MLRPAQHRQRCGQDQPKTRVVTAIPLWCVRPYMKYALDGAEDDLGRRDSRDLPHLTQSAQAVNDRHGVVVEGAEPDFQRQQVSTSQVSGELELELGLGAVRQRTSS